MSVRRKKLGVVFAAAVLTLGAQFGATGIGNAQTKPFVYAEAFPFSTMDPAAAGLNPDMLVTQNTYDALTRYDEDDPATILPALATEWSQNGKDWTFKIRQGVKFHSGALLSANDVKVSIDRMLKIGQGLSFLLYNVESVDVVDDATVVIHAKTANPWLSANLTKVGIVSARDVEEHASGDDLAAGWFAANENGTGAYRVSSHSPGVELRMERNKEWWGEFSDSPVETFIDRFVVDGTQRFIGLRGGDYQMAAFISTENALSLDRDKFDLVVGNNLWAYPNLNFSLTQEPTSNDDFRAALVASFDYSAMVTYYKDYATTSNGPVPGWVPRSPNDKLPTIKQDLDKAKSLLEKSGVTDTSFTCLIPAGSPDYIFVGQVLQAGAAQIGINVELRTVPISQIPGSIKGNEAPCAVYGEASNSIDPVPFFRARYVPGAFLNLWNYDNPEMGKLIDAYAAASDQAVQDETLFKMSKLLVDSHMDLWTVSPQSVIPMPKSVAGYKVDPFNLINVDIADLSYKP